MNKRILICAWIVVMSQTSCDRPWFYETGNGQMVSEVRSIDGFEKLVVRGFYEVLLEEGDHESVFVEADENLIELIETERIGRTLKIFNDKSIRSEEGIRIVVTYRNLETITSTGAAIIENRGPLVADYLELNLKGAGIINLQVEVDEIDVELSGVGLIELDGAADLQRVSLKGAGNLSAYDFETEETTIQLSGVGAAQVFARNRLDARVKGIGHISYRGDPVDLDKKVIGLGAIEEDRDHDRY